MRAKAGRTIHWSNGETPTSRTGTPRHITGRHVFWRGEGQRYKAEATRLALIKKRAGLAFRTHDLRHRFAINYLKAGGDIYELKRILGHS